MPQRLEAGLELRNAQGRGSHVHAAAAGPEVEGNADNADATHAWLQVGGHVDSGVDYSVLFLPDMSLDDLLRSIHHLLPHIVATLGVLVALGTTAHIVLYKSDVRAAIGWAGLVWLAPFIGAMLYWMLGINRIRRPRRPHAPRHRALVRLHPGNRREATGGAIPPGHHAGPVRRSCHGGGHDVGTGADARATRLRPWSTGTRHTRR